MEQVSWHCSCGGQSNKLGTAGEKGRTGRKKEHCHIEYADSEVANYLQLDLQACWAERHNGKHPDRIASDRSGFLVARAASLKTMKRKTRFGDRQQPVGSGLEGSVHHWGIERCNQKVHKVRKQGSMSYLSFERIPSLQGRSDREWPMGL